MSNQKPEPRPRSRGNAQPSNAATSSIRETLRAPFPFISKGPRVQDLLVASGLAPGVAARIEEITRKTRLWSSEQKEVARDLIAHAQDAIDAGREPEEIASSLGEPGRVAPLIRRAMKQKRPWIWHAQRHTVRGVLLATGLALTITGALFARFYMGAPNPSRSFIAELNAPNEHVPERDKAWPLYEEAQRGIYALTHAERPAMLERARAMEEAPGYDPAKVEHFADQPGVDLLPSISPEHPDYPEVLAMLEQLQPELSLIRAATRKPSIGMLYSTELSELPDDFDVSTEWPSQVPVPPPADPADQAMVFEVLLPHLGIMRQHANWLTLDARVGAERGESERVQADLLALCRMARQSSTEPFMISQLVAQALAGIAATEIRRDLAAHPELLSRAQLVELAHELGATGSEVLRLELMNEQIMMEDFLQRAYTDAGKGKGRITDEGLKLTRMLASFTQADNAMGNQDAPISPLTAMGLAPRDQQLATYSRLLAREQAAIDAGYTNSDWSIDSAIVELREHHPEFLPVTLLLPPVASLLDYGTDRRANLEATQAVIAMHVYHADTGAWPDSLEALTPRYLPEVPLDPFDLTSMKLTYADNAPVLYSIGADRDDDSARAVMGDENEKKVRQLAPFSNPKDIPDGDWVLYPVAP